MYTSVRIDRSALWHSGREDPHSLQQADIRLVKPLPVFVRHQSLVSSTTTNTWLLCTRTLHVFAPHLVHLVHFAPCVGGEAGFSRFDSCVMHFLGRSFQNRLWLV